MLLDDTEVNHLKSWLAIKLKEVSEADPQILSDYVVALLQAESSEETELKVNAIENLKDFLGDNTRRFVEEVFGVIRSKKYIPGIESPEKLEEQNQQNHRISTITSESRYETNGNNFRGHKRRYDDFEGGYVDWDAPNTAEGSNTRRHRRKRASRARAGPRGRERFGESHQKDRQGDTGVMRSSSFRSDARHDRQSSTLDKVRETVSDSFMANAGYAAPLFGGSSLSQAPQNTGFDGGVSNIAVQPFDPNVALQAILTLQSMGFPMPGIGPLPAFQKSPNGSDKSQRPCRDYQSKGVCPRGSSCRFQHEGHKIQIHDQEADKTTNDAVPTWDAEAAQKKYEARKALLEQTELKRQELIAKQKEIESQKAVELQKLKDIMITKGKKLPPDLEETSDTADGNEKTKQLLAQLKALEDEAKSLGLDQEPWFNGEHGYYSSNSYHGRGHHHYGWRGYPRRGRGHTRGTIPRNGAYNLDNRTKQVRVEDIDFDSAKEEKLKQHLFTVGDFESVAIDQDHKSCIVNFKDRHTAEAFYFGPTDIPDVGKVKFSWVPKLPVSSSSTRDEDTEMSAHQEDLSSTQIIDSSKDRANSSDHAHQRGDDAGYGDEDYEWIV